MIICKPLLLVNNYSISAPIKVTVLLSIQALVIESWTANKKSVSVILMAPTCIDELVAYPKGIIATVFG